MHLRIGRRQTTFSPNIEEKLEDVEQARALQSAEMHKRTSSHDAAPPRTGGVPNEHGYQEDQPLDAASATCCALLRPLPEERQASLIPRPGAPNAKNQGFAKR